MKKDEYFSFKDGRCITIPSFDKLLETLQIRITDLEEENDILHNKVSELKSEICSQKELAELNKKYKKLREDYTRGFPISAEEQVSIDKWKQEQPRDSQYIYKFIITPLGITGYIYNITNSKEYCFKECI
jgi:vacuolar-type H+-ATPase subunit I/STV1